MYARVKRFGMMIVGAMLLAGCSHDDVTVEVTPSEAVAISFAATTENGTNGTRAASTAFITENGTNGTRAVIGKTGVMNSEDLYYTGFGIFVSQNAGKLPDMMYNQKVEFTFVGDITDPLKGFWSYQPIKYWPSSLDNEHKVYISAYAPYMDKAAAGEDDTGIVSMSANTDMPYIDYRRCKTPEETVDLLWYYGEREAIPAATATHAAGTLSMKMHHALARLQINVKLASAPASGTKVLVEKIVLTGAIAKQGRLSLNSQTTETVEGVTKYYPVWSNQTYEASDHTITIDNMGGESSYGIIDPQVRYIAGMPFLWQPDGLDATNLKNALYSVDRQSYVYLIPQETLSLKVKVKYHKMTSSSDDSDWKTTTAETTTVGNPLRGNTTYSLDLTLSDI